MTIILSDAVTGTLLVMGAVSICAKLLHCYYLHRLIKQQPERKYHKYEWDVKLSDPTGDEPHLKNDRGDND